MSQKEARSTLLGASFPVPCFPPKEPGDACKRVSLLSIKAGEAGSGGTSGVICAAHEEGSRTVFFFFFAHTGTWHGGSELFICFRGKA